jgi:hypothetical protein
MKSSQVIISCGEFGWDLSKAGRTEKDCDDSDTVDHHREGNNGAFGGKEEIAQPDWLSDDLATTREAPLSTISLRM